MHFRTDTLGRRCQWLGLAIASLWLLSIWPAQHFFGLAGIEAAAVSAISCLLAGWLTFVFAARVRQPRMQAFAVLFGMVIRGIFALLGALSMQYLLGLPFENYLIWLCIFYLAALALETGLMLEPPRGTRAD